MLSIIRTDFGSNAFLCMPNFKRIIHVRSSLIVNRTLAVVIIAWHTGTCNARIINFSMLTCTSSKSNAVDDDTYCLL